MRKLLNTLFVSSEDIYLSLDNENVAAWRGDTLVQKMPLINLENIFYFGYRGASPTLLGACVKRNIGFCFLTPHGQFLARASGITRGSVLLHKEQYRISDDETESCRMASAMISAKILNARAVLMRAARDHPLSVDQALFQDYTAELMRTARAAHQADTLEALRGIEGNAAQMYFSLFDSLILADKSSFFFHRRSKRPPLDRVNALLSFTYTLLTHDCASALEVAGLDASAGFLHRDRPGRASLALDLMEELRSIYADRFVLTLINNRVIRRGDFQQMEDGAVWLNETGRKNLLRQWQERKRESITHPFLKEKIPWGLIPYVQALLLGRCLRGDLDGYPPFLWK